MHLARLDDHLDSTRADIILTVEQVYARVRWEEMWQNVMCSNDNISHPAVMAMKGTDRAEDNTDQASRTLAPHVKGTNRSAEKGNALVTQNLEKWVIDSG